MGEKRFKFTDPSRRSWTDASPRPLTTTVWYPARKGSIERRSHVSVFDAGWSAENAAISDARRKYPLILLSHGTGGSAASISWLGKSLARRGFIVAAVNHHGNTGAEPDYLLQGFMLWWERPRDVSALIDRLIDDPDMGPRIDADNIGVAGFSLGGYTALACVGARLGIARWKKLLKDDPDNYLCHPPPEAPFTMDEVRDYLKSNPDVPESMKHADDDFSDKRIKAAYVIAPVLGPIVSEISLQKIAVPVRIVAGSRDDQGVPESNAAPISRLIPESQLLIVPGATHYMFLCRGNLFGKILARRYFIDPPGLDRAKLQDDIGDDAARFFGKYLHR